MKVLVVALSARVGGGLTYVTRQMESLATVRPAWELDILAAPWNAPMFHGVVGATVSTIKVHGAFGRIFFEQLVLPFTGREADVIYCPGNFVPFAATRPLVVTQQKPHYFGTGWALTRDQGLRLWLERRFALLSMQRADQVVVVSDALGQEIAKEGVSSATHTMIHSGMPDVADASVRPAGLTDADAFFLTLANDNPHKRLDDVVTAWAALAGERIPSLVLAGRFTTARIQHHRGLVAPERVDRLIHLGTVADRREVRWLLENALALVVSSELESFGLTTAEAGAVGCPLIVSDIPPHREVTGGRGEFFVVGDIRDLTRRMAAIMRGPVDRVVWRWPMSWDENAHRLAQVLERAASGPV